MREATWGCRTLGSRRRVGPWRALAAGTLLALAPAVWAGPDEDLFKKADDALNRADYDAALGALSELTTKYTASQYLNQAKFKLGYAYYLKNEPINAVRILQPLAAPNFPVAEIREAAHLLMGQAMTRVGEMEQDAKRKEPHFNDAIKAFTEFLAAYPKSESRPDAVYSRAVASLYRGSHDDALKDLDYFQQQFPNHALFLDSRFLRATVLGAKAAAMIKAGSKEDGMKVRDQARGQFQELFASRADLALANQAAFSAAQLFFDAENYDDAVGFYRRVLPKPDIVAAQQEKVARLNAELPAIIRQAGNVNAPRVVQARQRLQTEQAKLEQFKNGPDFYVSAAIRIAVCYMAQEKWDEAQILCRHLLRNLEGDAVKQERKVVLDTMFRVQVGRKDPDAAQKYYDEFQTEFPKDPVAQDNGLFLGKVYWMNERYDDALKAIDRATKEYPTGTSAEEALVTKASVFLSKNAPQQALTQIQSYLKQYPPGKGKFVADSEYRLAQVNQQLGNLADALKGFRDVRTKHADQPFIEDVNLQVGVTLVNLGNASSGTNAASFFNDAVTELDQFQQRYASSQLMPVALLQLNDAYVGLLKLALAAGNTNALAQNIEKAVNASKEILTRWPNDPQHAPMAQYRIGLTYFWAKQYDKMAAAFQELYGKFKESPLQADAHFWVGYNYTLLTNHVKAIEEYGIVTRDFPKSGVAPDASLRVGQGWSSLAFAIGKSRALMPPDKAQQWDYHVEKAIAAFEQTMADYPETPSAQTAVTEILNLLTSKLRNKIIDSAGVDAYFKKLLDGPAGKNTALKVGALFALGNLQLASGESKLAIATFDRAAKEGPAVELDPRSYEAYAKALVANNRFDEAVRAYQKMAEVARKTEEWPAWADAQFGIGHASFLKRDFANARRQFEQFTLLADGVKGNTIKPGSLTLEQRALVNSKSLAEAQLGMASILYEEKKYDDAINKFDAYIQGSRGANRPRARAVIGLGKSYAGRAESRMGDQAKADLEAAYGNLSKAADFYTAFDDIVAEALFLSGQALEKLGRIEEARKIYDDASKRFATDPNGVKARESLAKLPPPPPPAAR